MENHLSKIKEELAKKSPLYIKVKIVPKSSQTEIFDRLDDETYKIRVAAMPIKGAANEALCKFLRKSLGATEVKIISGGRDAIKLIRINQ